jgi:hypothetical protein
MVQFQSPWVFISKLVPTKFARSAKMGFVIDYPQLNFNKLYRSILSPICELDCGKKCATHHPLGIPFCCDICHAIPAAYDSEWEYLQKHTDLWHLWNKDDCKSENGIQEVLIDNLPENMVLLACKGVQDCQRPYRTISCRQFPFFPYVTADFRFIGLAYEWEFENQCWVISHLDQVSDMYRQEFIQTFDELFNLWPEEMESYAVKSEEMRSAFIQKRYRIPILHRNGKNYLLSPLNENIRITSAKNFRVFNPY